ILGSLRIYGEHLGLLIQVKDDLEDFKLDTLSVKSGRAHQLKSALPVVYAREVLPEMDKDQLDEALSRLSEEADAAARVHQLLDQSGASLYILTEIERHQQGALKALDAVSLKKEAARQLKLIVEAE
ncbi:MAG TPA: hypothetical protein VLA49_07795, partial [Anaerolineales bacterium]|nr:hypothetical protein [Anaerolineales bacterium]